MATKIKFKYQKKWKICKVYMTTINQKVNDSKI